ncbi:MAG TPA: hypothetical protein ENI33_05465 [Thermoplasmatales archaeon]|nr:hypothetical protein [Thermoplasmatales archaeon]
MLAQCAADFHGRKERYERFINYFEKVNPDLIIIPGDLGYVNASIFEKIDIPVYAVYGNMNGDLRHLEEKINFIDGREVSYKGINFAGFGREILNLKEKIDVLISHVPPYKTKDRAFFGMHIGDKMLRKFMEEKKPRYILCGHVHEDAGYQKFGETYVVNCSIGKNGVCTLIDFNKNDIRFINHI